MKLTLGVVRKDKEILLFPLISGIIMIAIVATFVLGMFFTGLFYFDNPILFIVLTFIMYLVLYFIAIYFNTAVIGCATIRLQGGDPTLSDGFRTANENLRAIFGWAVLSATVGLIIRAIQQRAGVAGRIAGSIFGIAWSIVTYFIIPVLIYEKTPLFKGIKRSAKIFKDTWGETFISGFGLGIVFALLGLLGIVFIVLGVLIGGITGLIVGLIIAIVYWVIIAVVASAAQGVLIAALYRFATTGKITPDVLPAHLIPPTKVKKDRYKLPPYEKYQYRPQKY
jgi:hypothetical protein